MSRWPLQVRKYVAVCCLLLPGCGGIEGTGSPMAGIEGTGVTEGSASGFGSVYVNGIEFTTDDADIIVDGQPVAEEALQVGMLLSVTGAVLDDGAHGRARRVEFDRPLLGPVDAWDPETRRLVILGQSVQLDDASLLDGVAEADLQDGQLCLMSGHAAPDGGWLATLLRCSQDYVAGVTEVEAEGVVSGLDTDEGGFRIGDLTVQFAGAALDTTQGALADGARIEAIGRQPDRHGALQAARVRVKSAALPAGQAVLLEGIIGRFAGLGDFELNHRRIDASAAQRQDSHQLIPAGGVRMRLAGTARADGVIAAEQYVLQPATNVLLTGRVDGVDSEQERLLLFGSERRALSVTQYEDESGSGQRRFRLRDLAAGDYVQLRGFRDAQGHMVITRVERRDEEEPTSGTVVARFRVQLGDGEIDPAAARVLGPLDSRDLTQNMLVIAGITVQTDAARTEFFDRDGASVTAVQFYNGLQPGDRLEAEGNENSDLIQATRVAHAR
jgi:hypothetical protein